MADIIVIYISAAADLALEREVLNRAITEIPTTLAWRIVETPLTHIEPDLDSVVAADIHLLLLGGDVRAPVGVEWAVARRAGRLPVLYLKNSVTHTQAAQAFIRELERYTEWHRYEHAGDLRIAVLKRLADHILERREHYSLKDSEYTSLSDWRKQLRKSPRQKVDDTRGGAGNSSLILSLERYMPSDGVLLNDPASENRNPASTDAD